LHRRWQDSSLISHIVLEDYMAPKLPTWSTIAAPESGS
jgi:hypothetical protein